MKQKQNAGTWPAVLLVASGASSTEQCIDVVLTGVTTIAVEIQAVQETLSPSRVSMMMVHEP